MSDFVPPSKQAAIEAASLAEEILRNVELSEIPLNTIALKCMRLARLLNDFSWQSVYDYESSGYPSNPDGMTSEVFELGRLANRVRASKDEKTSEIKETCYSSSIASLESQLASNAASIPAAQDAPVSITSANPHQFIAAPQGNIRERIGIRGTISTLSDMIAERRALIYKYALTKYEELRFSSIADDLFSEVRTEVDTNIGAVSPQAVGQFTAIYENLRSTNPEDWSNAVHSCRRVLQSTADALRPTSEDSTKVVDGKERKISMGPDAYINRLIDFVEQRSDSTTFNSIVGSHLHYLGDRLDAIFRSAQKGSHSSVTKREADRYVVYTYLLLGDILSL